MELNDIVKKSMITSHFLKIVMIILLIIAIWNNNWTGVFGCVLGIILSIIPSILKRNYSITLPWFLDLLIAFALFLHIGGVVLYAYIIIPGYDTITHFVSSIVIAFLAFVVIYLLDIYWDGLHMDKYAMAFVVVVFTMAMGVLWEFFEWSIDMVFGTTEQLGLYDTMKDLLIDTGAGLFMAFIGVNMIKRGKFQDLVDGLDKQFNKSFFGKKK
jgi:hypothetical protein